MSTMEGYHEYTGWCSVQWEDIMSTPWDTMMSVEDTMSTAGVFSTPGDTMSTLGDKMMSVGDIMSIWMFSTLGFPYKFSCFPNDLNAPPHLSLFPLPQCTHDIPQFTEHPQCTFDVLMKLPSVLNILLCTAHTLCRVRLAVF